MRSFDCYQPCLADIYVCDIAIKRKRRNSRRSTKVVAAPHNTVDLANVDGSDVSNSTNPLFAKL